MGRIGPTAEWNQPTHELAVPHLVALVRASRRVTGQQQRPAERARRDSRAPIEETVFTESGTVAIATDISAPVVITARPPAPEEVEGEDLIPVEVVADADTEPDAEPEAEPDAEPDAEPELPRPAPPATSRAATRDPVYPVYRDRLAPVRLLTWVAMLGAAGAAAALVLVS
jgi:hypothetical protein